MAGFVTIEKDADDKILILATQDAKETCRKKISVDYEGVEVNLVEEFLTAVGMEQVSLSEEESRMRAKEAVRICPPKKLNERFGCNENLYNREELSHLYNLTYLHSACDMDAFTALACGGDDEFWFAVFPETVHTCAFLNGVELKGNEHNVQRAVSIRRRQLVELNLLSASVVLLHQRPDEYTIEGAKGAIPKGLIKQFEHAGSYVTRTIKTLQKEKSADYFITHESTKYDFNWLKKKADLKFLNSATITISHQAEISTFHLRAVLFSFNPN